MSNTTRVSEALARPVRTAAQAAPSWVITEFVDAFFWDMTDRQFGVMVLLLTMLFAYLQAAIENGIGKGFLRNVPPANVPVVDAKESEASPGMEYHEDNAEELVGEPVAPEHDLNIDSFDEEPDEDEGVTR